MFEKSSNLVYDMHIDSPYAGERPTWLWLVHVVVPVPVSCRNPIFSNVEGKDVRLQ
jgi:hypothetical protein